jgi:putative heme-binding domain-containing protein
LLTRLERQRPLSAAQFPLLQLLDPQRAAHDLLAKLAQPNLDDPSAMLVLESAANIPSLDAGWGLLTFAENTAHSTALRRAAMEKITANLNRRGGWSAMAHDGRFSAALRGLLADDALRATALAAIAKLRITRLGAEVLTLAEATDLDAAARAQAIDTTARLRPPGAAAALFSLLSDPQPKVAQAAMQALVDLQDIRSLREILAGDTFPAEMRRATAERLIDSVGGAIVLLRLIDENQLPDGLKRSVVAKAVAHPDSNVRVLYEKFIPESERPKTLGKAISADSILALAGDANRGRAIFNKSSAALCKQCHAVQGFGGTLGPDLTKIGKKYERKTLLETILDPSKAIAPEFIAYLLETQAGQVYVGFLVERTAEHVVLKDVQNQRVRVATDQIESLVPQPKSLMPELVLSDVTPQDAADLLAYLITLQ